MLQNLQPRCGVSGRLRLLAVAVVSTPNMALTLHKVQHCPGVIPNGNIAHRCLVANNKSTPEKPEVQNCVCRHKYAHP